VRETVRRTVADNRSSPRWRPWGITALGVLITFSLVNSGIRHLVACIYSAREVVYKTRQYEQMVATNKAAEQELEFRKTAEGKIQAAREELGYINQDEELVEPIEDVQVQAHYGAGSRLWAWLDETGARASVWARDAIDITKCMMGVWQPVMPEDQAALTQ
jgi:cell division protein FtsB